MRASESEQYARGSHLEIIGAGSHLRRLLAAPTLRFQPLNSGPPADRPRPLALLENRGFRVEEAGRTATLPWVSTPGTVLSIDGTMFEVYDLGTDERAAEAVAGIGDLRLQPLVEQQF